jgi:hypothetical protein
MPKGLLTQFLRLLVGRRPLPFFSSPIAPPVQAIEPAAQQLAPLVPTVDPVAPVEAPPPSGNDIVVTDDKDEATPLPFLTPAVIKIAGNALADASTPNAASAFTLGCGAFIAPRWLTPSRPAALVADARRRAPCRSPAPAVHPRTDSLPMAPPPSPSTAALRRLVALRLPLPHTIVGRPRKPRRQLEPGRAGTRRRRHVWHPPIHYSDEVA